MKYRAYWAEWCEFTNPETATTADVWRFITVQKKRKGFTGRESTSDAISWDTIAHKFILLNKFYNHLLLVQKIQRNPFHGVQIPKRSDEPQKRPTQALEAEDVKRILDIPGNLTKKGTRDNAILAAFFGAGLRLSENQKLKMQDYSLTTNGTRYLKLKKTKNRKNANQALPDWAAVYITEHYQIRLTDGAEPTDPLWPTYIGEDEQPRGEASTSTIQRLFKRYCRLAGLNPKDFSVHSARATSTTVLLDSGATIDEAQEFLRHATTRMVKAYDKRKRGIDEQVAKRIKY
jgi:site-specific recombinase XerD